MSKKKVEIAVKEPVKVAAKSEWFVDVETIDMTPSRASKLEAHGWEIFSIAPVAGGFGVQMAIIARKELKS